MNKKQSERRTALAQSFSKLAKDMDKLYDTEIEYVTYTERQMISAVRVLAGGLSVSLEHRITE